MRSLDRKRQALTAIVVSAAFAGLAGCDGPLTSRPAPDDPRASAADAAFTHDIGDDLSGYYRPVSAVTAGDYRLTHLFLGQAADFEAWEDGSKSRAHGPVMIEFANASGTSVRVLPKAYAVSARQVRFAGSHPDLGEVSFEGSLDAGALATAKRNLGDEAPVLSGTLRVGGRSFGQQKFRWYGGD